MKKEEENSVIFEMGLEKTWEEIKRLPLSEQVDIIYKAFTNAFQPHDEFIQDVAQLLKRKSTMFLVTGSVIYESQEVKDFIRDELRKGSSFPFDFAQVIEKACVVHLRPEIPPTAIVNALQSLLNSGFGKTDNVEESGIKVSSLHVDKQGNVTKVQDETSFFDDVNLFED